MLAAVEDTARQGIATVHAIKEALLQVKHRIRSAHRFYSQDLINNLYTDGAYWSGGVATPGDDTRRAVTRPWRASAPAAAARRPAASST